MSDSQHKTEKDETENKADSASDAVDETVNPTPASPPSNAPHPMAEMTGAAASPANDATAGPDLSTAQSNAEGARKAETQARHISDFPSTSITIIPPIRDFGSRPSDTGGPEGAARTWPLTAAQMRQWALAAAAIVMTVGAAGAFAVTGMSHFGSDAAIPAKAAASASLATENAELKQTVSKLGADLAELRNALDRASKASTSQIGRVIDRVDRMEKAQIEPNARLARLSETVERLNAAPKAQAASQAPTQTQASAMEKAPDKAAAAKNADVKAADVTGSVAAPAQTAAAQVAPEPKKPPIVPGWTLREVSDGGALVQGPLGLYDVYPGDPLPGLNRVEAIRREGGRWVVVTRKGWIVSR